MQALVAAGPDDAVAGSRDLGDAVARLLVKAARDRSLLVVVDDAQALSPRDWATLVAVVDLAAASETPESGRLRVLAAARPLGALTGATADAYGALKQLLRGGEGGLRARTFALKPLMDEAAPPGAAASHHDALDELAAVLGDDADVDLDLDAEEDFGYRRYRRSRRRGASLAGLCAASSARTRPH